jgi:glycosyltransferase involved in cell wall biosynthesis
LSGARFTVAHVVGTTGRTGVEAHLQVLFDGLRAHEVRPILVCPQEGPLTDDLAARGYEVRIEAPRRRAGVTELGRLARAVKDADLVHGHGPRVQWWTAALRKSGGARRAVATLHEIGRSGMGSRGPRRVFDAIEGWTLRAHDRLIAVSDFIRRRAVAESGVPRERVDVVLNSTRLMFDPPRALDPPAAPAYAFAAARLQPEKGLDVLIDALALVPRDALAMPVVVAGEGVDRAALEARARARGVDDRIALVGWVDDAPERTRRAAFYLNPSRDEPCSVAVLEAMALGTLVVATNVGGNVELLGDDGTPALVPAEDPAALARAIVIAQALSPEERLAARRKLQARAYECFSPKRMAEGTLATYARLGLGG